jgi:uncharacterized protein (DUF1697 family)
MTVHVALLRAINLAGHNRVSMADLRELLAELGLKDPKSLLQSGNLVFEADGRTSAQLETLLENGAKKRLNLETDFFVRTAAEWKRIISGNPFPEEAERDPGHLVVMFLKDAPGRKEVGALQGAIAGREVVRAKGRHAYVVYPDGIGRSRLTNAMIERVLGTRATGRNWNTVLKLGALVEA